MARPDWFREANVEFSIHWGAYAVAGGEASWPIMIPQWFPRVSISEAEYNALPKQFNPTQFDPKAWVQMAKQAGLRCLVFTSQHHARVRRVFRPESGAEWHLVERLARATWRRIRVFRAQARLERYVWRHLPARSGKARLLSTEEISDRACEVSKLLGKARLVENEAYKLQDRIERILAALIRERARAEKM